MWTPFVIRCFLKNHAECSPPPPTYCATRRRPMGRQCDTPFPCITYMCNATDAATMVKVGARTPGASELMDLRQIF